MDLPLVGSCVGSAAIALFGVGHGFGYLAGRKIGAGQDHARALKAVECRLPTRTRPYFDLYECYSWTMVLMLVGYGVFGVVLASIAPGLVAGSRALAAVNLAVALGCLWLGRRYFFSFPIVLSS